jgi:hypothetical protein
MFTTRLAEFTRGGEERWIAGNSAVRNRARDGSAAVVVRHLQCLVLKVITLAIRMRSYGRLGTQQGKEMWATRVYPEIVCARKLKSRSAWDFVRVGLI